MQRSKFIFAAAVSLLSSCAAPGLEERLTPDQTQEIKKVVVVSAIGDKVTYYRQGVFKGDVNDLVFPDSRVDDEIANRVSVVVARRLGVESKPYGRGSNKSLFSLYNNMVAPGNAGLEFSNIAAELSRIRSESGADTIILIFKGVIPLPGGMGGPGFWVKGAAVSDMRGNPCTLAPNLMISILPRNQSRPVASGRLPVQNHFLRLPEEVCAGKLVDPPREQAELIARAMSALISENSIDTALKALLAN